MRHIELNYGEAIAERTCTNASKASEAGHGHEGKKALITFFVCFILVVIDFILFCDF